MDERVDRAKYEMSQNEWTWTRMSVDMQKERKRAETSANKQEMG